MELAILAWLYGCAVSGEPSNRWTTEAVDAVYAIHGYVRALRGLDPCPLTVRGRMMINFDPPKVGQA